ncbi:hypothetical protein [Sporolactobacillus laevolacticus]|uniref:DUF2914 domain-containing protein n=1 Tax=Sporolactobacillus laevolacticus DSM 442 TaxID=1395513 RepID=V6J644_9BACL|nr:hypothetical protein [Sporolactobacillus laevolacticus]EST12239.1 hypothetical protein P343_08200 [Sporolactobacillus laevolacticus DSM 442]
MKKILKLFTAALLSLGILTGVALPQGIVPAAPQNVAYAKTAPLKVTSSLLNVYRGQYAYFTIKGKKNVQGYATVYYKSGTSRSKTLGYQKSNNQGLVTWRWKVGTNTTPGTWKVYVKLGNQTKYLYLTVHRR